MVQNGKAAPRAIEPELVSPGGEVMKTIVGPTNALVPRGGVGAMLMVCMGPMTGQRHGVGERLIMGRSDACDIVLADDRVSGRHCEVFRVGDGYRIRDLSSSNGTLVNAQKVQEAELRDGDLLQVGFTVFKFLGSATTGRGQRIVTNDGSGRVERMPEPQMIMNTTPQPQPQVVVQTGAPPEKEMSLEDMVGSARRGVNFFWPWRKLIVIAAALGAAAGMLSFFIKPPPASATFEMTISSSFDKSTGNVLADRGHAAEPAFTSNELIARSLTVLGQEPSMERIGVIQKLLQFRSLTPSYMMLPVMKFAGEFTAATDDAALGFLQTHVTQFIDSEVEKTTKIMRGKIDFLNEQIGKSNDALKVADESLRTFRKEKLASLPESTAKSQEQMFDLERDVGDLTADLDRIKMELQSATSSTGSGRKQRAVQALREQLAELRSGGLGDNHPDVVAMREKIVRAEAAPDDAPSGRSGDKSASQLRADQSSKTNLLAQKKKQLDALKAAVASTPDFEARYAELNRSYASAKKSYDQLSDDRNQAEYQLGLEKTAVASRFEVTRPPRLESQSAVKGIVKRLVMFAAFGLALSFGFAAFQQLRRIWRRS